MRGSIRRFDLSKIACSILGAILLTELAACVSTPTSGSPAASRAPQSIERKPERVDSNAQTNERKSEGADTDAQATVAAPIERRRRDYPELETDETGFTITERIRIGGQVRGDYDNALQLLAQQRYDEAIELLIMITEEAPDLSAPYIDLGIAYSRSGDLERAEAALQTASRLSPEHPIVHNELGILYRKMGRFDAARASYEKALDIYPDFHFARRNLGVLCDLYLADLSCALEQYVAYLQSVDTDAEVEVWVTDLHNRLGQ